MAMIKMSPEEIRAKSQSYGQGSDQTVKFYLI